jgi:hypothetical protein
MKYIIFSVFGLIISFAMSAQAFLSTGEGGPTDADASAALEIHSQNAGLLIPTISLMLDEGVIKAPGISVTPADGLTIYHNGANGISKGLYYYDADLSRWVLYSDFSSTLSEAGLDDFGVLKESNDLGAGTYYDLYTDSYNPWNTASLGLTGSTFEFKDDVTISTETGTAIADQFEINGPHAIYSVIISATILASDPAPTITGALFINDTKVDHIFFRHTFQLKDDPTSLNTSGNIEVYDGDRIDFRFTSDVKNKGLYLENLNIRFTKMGEL